MKLHSSCIWSVFLGRCHSFVKFNLPRAKWRAPYDPMTKRTTCRWSCLSSAVSSLRLSFGWVFKARLVSMVSMFHFHDWSRKNVKSRNLASSKQVYCWVYTYLYYLFFLLTWIFRFFPRPKGDWDSVTFIFLAQWRATTFDPKIRQRIGWSWWWDKQRWLSDDQWTKEGGVGMLVRVTWRKMSTFFRNMVRNWSKLNKEVWSWLARYFQLYIVYLLFQHQPVANS